MTPKYWIRIGIGMLVMLFIAIAFNRGVTKGAEFLSQALPSGLPLINSGFHVDGERLGGVERIQLMRSMSKRVDSAVLTVKLDADATDATLADCQMMVVNSHSFNNHPTFSCASDDDAQGMQLEPFGHVVLMPGDRSIPLSVSKRYLANFRHENYSGGGDDSGDVDIQSSNGHLSISVNGREIVQASGDSNGGSLVIRDQHGNPIVQISGDSSGGRVRINDAQGKARVNINATDGKKKSS